MVDFPTTIWTNIRRAVTCGGSVNPDAMSDICDLYDKPLRTLIGTICWSKQDADDLAQDFILGMSQGKYLSKATENDGRLRHYLFRCGKNFLRNAWRKQQAEKRGGGSIMVSIDENPESTPLPDLKPTAEQEFDREWARTMISRTLTSLEKEHGKRGRPENFPHLVAGLGWTPSTKTSDELAKECDMSGTAFRTAIHRLKQRFSDQMRQEIRETVSNEEEVADELRYLLTVFSK